VLSFLSFNKDIEHTKAGETISLLKQTYGAKVCHLHDPPTTNDKKLKKKKKKKTKTQKKIKKKKKKKKKHIKIF
jgi:hypothetical protein